jgi:hypothetical protein
MSAIIDYQTRWDRRFRLSALLFAMSVAALGADSGRILYTKSFPGSSPAYVAITVERSGAVSYKEEVDDDPEKFQLEESGTDVMFDLAARLDHFKHPLESGLKVANMGVKTFRWEDEGAASEQKFNYSLDESAKALHDWFEAITETERLFAELKRHMARQRAAMLGEAIRASKAKAR